MAADNNLDTATRIAAADDGSRYDNVAVWLHWATAVLVVTQFALGQTWGWFPRPTRHLMVVTHMSFGIILTAVIVARLAWRFGFRHSVSSLETGLVRLASRTVQGLLYALLASEAVLGFLSRWEGNEAMSFFGLQIASPFTGAGQKLAHQLEDIHNYVGWAIIVLATGHALAALYHHYGLKDRVLIRMLPSGASRG
ncbi:MAG: cytochrome b [Sphingomicrobium sp.]